MRGRHNNRGFTLVEVIIASGIMTFGAALLVSITVDMHRFSVEEQMQNEIERETTLFLDYFSRDTMNAAGVQLEYPGTSKNGDKIVFKVPEFDSLGLRIPEEYDYVIYEHLPGKDYVTRSVFDDAEGDLFVSDIVLPFSQTHWWTFVNGVPLSQLDKVEGIRELQASLMRNGSVAGFDYQRRMIATSTLRNSEY